MAPNIGLVSAATRNLDLAMGQRGKTRATGQPVVSLQSAFSPPRIFGARRSPNIVPAGMATKADLGAHMPPGQRTRLRLMAKSLRDARLVPRSLSLNGGQ